MQTLQVTLGCLETALDVLSERAGEVRGGALCGDLPPEAKRIVHLAKSLADGDSGAGADFRPLAPVFAHLNGEHPGWAVVPTPPEEGRLLMPAPDGFSVSPAQYQALLAGAESELSAFAPMEDWINPMLDCLERWAGVVPGVFPEDEAPDISLYDQVRIRAAVGAALSEALPSSDVPATREDKLFLLYSAEISGSQEFIEGIPDGGTLRTLSGRSIFLELLLNHYADELLEACGVSRVGLLLLGGGKCRMLLPNTEKTLDALKRVNCRFNDWLMDQFGVQFFLAHGWAAASADELFGGPYGAVLRRADEAMARHRMHPCSADQLRRLNGAPEEGSRECRACGRTGRLDEEGLCPWCRLFDDLPERISEADVCLVSYEPMESEAFALPAAEGMAHFTLTDEAEARRALAAGEPITRIYTKNRAIGDLPRAICLYLNENGAAMLSGANDEGQRFALCRLDADGLGQALAVGFERDGSDAAERYRYATLPRASALARQVSKFFQREVPSIAASCPDGETPCAAVVYSGGVLLAGTRSGVLGAAVRVRENLKAFSGGALSVSAGISECDPRLWVRTAANDAARLEKQARESTGGNAVALSLGAQARVYNWDVFLDKVMGEKLQTLERFFSAPDQERGGTLLRRLEGLLLEAQDERLNLARYAYTLARLEPRRDGPAREEYRNFAKNMYRWALEPEDRGQLITAIAIYVRQDREGR